MKVTARVQRSGDWWAIEVPEVPGVFTQAKRLEQVPDLVADAVALMVDDVDAADVEVDVVPDLAGAAAGVLQVAIAAATAARAAQEQATRAMREAVTALRTEQHLTTRDTAELLGISHQRVAQIEAAAVRA